MSRRGRIALKATAWVLCLLPLAVLIHLAVQGELGANPISFVTNWLGQWTFRLLLVGLALTPLRILFGLAWPLHSAAWSVFLPSATRASTSASGLSSITTSTGTRCGPTSSSAATSRPGWRR